MDGKQWQEGGVWWEKLYMAYKYVLYQNNFLESTFDFLKMMAYRGKVQLFALVFGKKHTTGPNWWTQVIKTVFKRIPLR